MKTKLFVLVFSSSFFFFFFLLFLSIVLDDFKVI